MESGFVAYNNEYTLEDNTTNHFETEENIQYAIKSDNNFINGFLVIIARWGGFRIIPHMSPQ